MAYNIFKSDGSQLVALDDYLIDNTTLSINLIGKNVSGYGAQQNENFLYLLENFSKETPPASPLAGQLWYDKAANVARPMFYDGGTWRPLAVTLFSNTSSDTTIASGAVITSQAPGDFWFNTDKQQLFINTGTAYSLIGPEAVPNFGKTRLSSESLLDNGLNPHPVIKIVLDDEVIGVLSNTTFLGGVEAAALGFSNVYRGLTLKNYSVDSRYSTTSTDVVIHGLHEQLDESYPRRNVDEHIRANWFFDDDYMLQFGAAGNAKISFNSPGGGFANKLTIDHASGVIVLSSNGQTVSYNGAALTPNTSDAQSIGTASARFENVYTKTLNAGGSLVNSNIVGTWNLAEDSKFNPSGDFKNDLGQPTLRWNNVYTNNLNSGNDVGTFKGNWSLDSGILFYPGADNTTNLGRPSNRFGKVYANSLSSETPSPLGNGETLTDNPLSIIGNVTLTGSITPSEDNLYDLGSPQAGFNTVHASNINASSASIGSLSATVNQLLDSFSNTISRFDRDAQLTANSDSRLPTQKSVKAYVDATKNAILALIGDLQTSLQDSINSLEFVPAGAVFHVAMSTAPEGFLICDGSEKLTSSYPKLFAAIGYTYGGQGTKFRVPDLRGQFIRGWDSNRGLDNGRSFGTAQSDAIGSHTHNVDDLYGLNDDQGPAVIDRNGNRIEYYSGWGSDGDADSGNPAWFLNKTADGATGPETRPTNVALLPIIKY